MARDIEQLIAALQRTYPDLTAEPRRATDPDVDDEGVWCLNHPSAFTEVRVTSPTGGAPFTVDSELAPPVVVKSVDAAVKRVRTRLGLLVNAG